MLRITKDMDLEINSIFVISEAMGGNQIIYDKINCHLLNLYYVPLCLVLYILFY